MKKMFTSIMIMVLLLSLVGCGGKTIDTQTSEKSNENASIVIKVAATLPVEAPITKGCFKFEEELERLTDGKVDVKIYPAGQLGTGRETFEAVQQGTIEVCENSIAPFSGFNEEFLTFNLPYLFKNRQIAYEFLDSPMGQEMADSVKPSGFKILAFFDNGYRNVTNSKRPVRTPKDLEGLKIRTMENPVHMELFRQMNANPTPMAFAEVFTALQQKTVDGQENSFTNIGTMKFNEVQKYISTTQHVWDPTVLAMNADLYDSLDPEIQEAIDQAAQVAAELQRKLQIEADDSYMEVCKETSEVIELTDEDREAFKKATKGTYAAFEDKIGKEKFKEIQEAISKLEEKY